jgi:predicted 3-demethylubiquinone-9 3-methyltransferase (glyoxalase superfamily)
MQKITPFLWFDHQAEDAVRFYRTIFKPSKILKLTRYGDDQNPSGRPKGSVMTIEFELAGQRFLALNGGPYHKFSEAISFVVDCKTQKELDRYWTKLSAGGREIACGWLKDKYGLCWQIVPAILGELLTDRDPEKSNRVMQALLQMKKLDIKKLKAAARSES